MKKTLSILLVTLLVFLTILVVFYTQFNIFPLEEEFITSFIDAQRNHYEVVHIPGNATTNDVVQIRISLDNGKYTVVESLEGYNKFALLEADDSIRFIVWDTLRKNTVADTVVISQ